MFLNLLKEENKARFAELCRYAAYADDVLEKREQEMISTYCKEMGIAEILLDQKNGSTLDLVLSELNQNTSDTEKKIVLFEILGLLFSDDEYTEKEEQFVMNIIERFGLEKSTVTHMCSLLEIHKTVYQQIYTVVCL